MDIAPVVGSSIAAMTNPTGTVLGEAAQLAADLGAEASQSVALVGLPKEDKDEYQNPQPKSGINFVAYNEKFKVVPENTGVLMVEDKIHTIQTLTTDRIIIRESGFLEVYAHNEAQTPVYFDNMTVSRRAGAALEVNAYYPYGMLNPGLSSSNGDAPNAYKYNAKELQKELNLNWLDYGARMMDPAIARWMVPDPMAEARYNISPFAYASNNPINRIDPTGLLDGWYEDELKRILFDATINSQQDLKNAGIEGSYLGDTGYGINEGTGNAVLFSSDGTTKEFTQTISGVTVTPTVNYPTKNPSLSSGNQTGYVWDNKDLAVWNTLENSNSPIGKVVRLQVETGNYDILSAENYWNTYGNMLGQLLIGSYYLTMINGLAPGPNSVGYKGRGFSGMKVTPTKPASTSSEYIPTFNEFRTANKGAFTGYKGRGTSTQKAWEAYKAKYGDKVRMY